MASGTGILPMEQLLARSTLLGSHLVIVLDLHRKSEMLYTSSPHQIIDLFAAVSEPSLIFAGK